MFTRIKDWARRLKRDIVAIYLAGRDRRTPLAAKWLALGVAAYALSPIDLIPDFIPVLGYLDDLIILPLGIAAVVRMIPAALMQEFRDQADSCPRLPVNRWVGAGIVAVWVAGVVWVWRVVGG